MNREGNPTEWLNAAEQDRRAAQTLLQGELYGLCTFHCQQAVEKLLKAIIVQQTQQRPPSARDLRVLLDEVDLAVDTGIVDAAARIEAACVGAAYPVDDVDPSVFIRPFAETAVNDMQKVFAWFGTRVNFTNA